MNLFWDSFECDEPHLDAPVFMPAGSTASYTDTFEVTDDNGDTYEVTDSGAEPTLFERADAYWWPR